MLDFIGNPSSQVSILSLIVTNISCFRARCWKYHSYRICPVCLEIHLWILVWSITMFTYGAVWIIIFIYFIYWFRFKVIKMLIPGFRCPNVTNPTVIKIALNFNRARPASHLTPSSSGKHILGLFQKPYQTGAFCWLLGKSPHSSYFGVKGGACSRVMEPSERLCFGLGIHLKHSCWLQLWQCGLGERQFLS